MTEAFKYFPQNQEKKKKSICLTFARVKGLTQVALPKAKGQAFIIFTIKDIHVCKFLDDIFLSSKGKNLGVTFPLETLLL